MPPSFMRDKEEVVSNEVKNLLAHIVPFITERYSVRKRDQVQTKFTDVDDV